MTVTRPLPLNVAHEVRDRCLCFATQRAARQLARRFDRLLADIGLTNNQYSMMVAMSAVGTPKLAPRPLPGDGRCHRNRSDQEAGETRAGISARD